MDAFISNLEPSCPAEWRDGDLSGHFCELGTCQLPNHHGRSGDWSPLAMSLTCFIMGQCLAPACVLRTFVFARFHACPAATRSPSDDLLFNKNCPRRAHLRYVLNASTDGWVSVDDTIPPPFWMSHHLNLPTFKELCHLLSPRCITK